MFHGVNGATLVFGIGSLVLAYVLVRRELVAHRRAMRQAARSVEPPSIVEGWRRLQRHAEARAEMWRELGDVEKADHAEERAAQYGREVRAELAREATHRQLMLDNGYAA